MQHFGGTLIKYIDHYPSIRPQTLQDKFLDCETHSHYMSLVLGRSETPDEFESVAIAMFGTKLWLYCEVGRDVFSD